MCFKRSAQTQLFHRVDKTQLPYVWIPNIFRIKDNEMRDSNIYCVLFTHIFVYC